MLKNITECFHALLDFAENRALIEAEDREYTLNRLLEICQMDAPECDRPEAYPCPDTATPILDRLFEGLHRSLNICDFQEQVRPGI